MQLQLFKTDFINLYSELSASILNIFIILSCFKKLNKVKVQNIVLLSLLQSLRHFSQCLLIICKLALRTFFEVVLCPKRDQNICLDMVKKDQLCAIAFMKRENEL